MILVPVKALSNAKQRLAAVLDQEARTALAHAMLQDVLQTLAGWSNCPPVALVTTDPFARILAARFGFEIIVDANRSETDAIETATAICASCGAESTLVIPGD